MSGDILNGQPTSQTAPLRIGVSTRALFDLEEEHEIFLKKGVKAYAALQLERENNIIGKGCGFEVIDRLLKLNKPNETFVEVMILSQNSPDLSLRAFNSIKEYKLNIKTGSFTSGRPLAPFIPAWGIDLFLSNEASDVQAAISAGAAAARLGVAPKERQELRDDEVRIAFDGDAVVFSPESDEVYKNNGLSAFLRHEADNATKPMAGGPFGEFLKKLSVLRNVYMNDEGFSKVRIAIVTARNAPAHARVIHTLRAWGTPADEAHFVGVREKAPILKAFGAHIFFDDQEKHVLGASAVVPAGHVPGPHKPEAPVIPAG
ncbi:5'-nucleotidase [Ollibium composti]|uniref:5'-nucleotidase n=1 Tax=Ollibium composti TaxID=2675109 RepID=A0ABY2QC91_9HYPH|nr:5'-nucleotidase [Mesorhizobium composti]THF59599.1 5'-nucleotidase [Mesorhizobium composti]